MIEPPQPEDFARQLLGQLSIDRVTDLTQVLAPLRLGVRETEASSFEGLLVCRKDRSRGSIAVSTGIRELGRKRFTICHEIGHFVLPGHGESGCSAPDIEAWNSASSTKEIEANRFASEILLPTRLIYPVVEKKKATIALAKEISGDFETSLTAAAYKMVRVTNEACALVWSWRGRIKWFAKSDSFFGFIDRSALDQQSRAAQLMRDTSERESEGRVFAETWLKSDALKGKNKLWEDSICLPAYEGILTILTVDSAL